MPGYEFEISGEQVMDLICCICLMLIRKALLLPCSHTSCQDCLEKWENEHPGRNNCPTCNKAYDKEKVREGDQGKFIDRMVTNNVDIKCMQWEQGCEWVGKIANYDAHEKTCSYLKLLCRFDDCKKRVARKDMITHEQNCPYRLVACRFCQLNVAFTKMEDHLNLCEEYQVECSNNRCNKRMKRKELNHHLTEDCLFTIIACSFNNIGCNVQMARCESEKHFLDFSSFHSSLLLKNTESLTNQLKQQQLDFQKQSKQFQEQLKQQQLDFQQQFQQQSKQFQEQLKQQESQQEKRHSEEMENLRKRLDRLEILQPTKEELSALTHDEVKRNWTYDELFGLIHNEQFEKLNAILLLLPQLTDEQKSDKYTTLLHLASTYHAPIQTLQLLCQKGCELRDRNKWNELPIHYAANNDKAVEWMVREDISLLNEKGRFGYTPLHRAAIRNNKETIQVLLSHGADVNAKDTIGWKADELDGVNDEIKKMIREYRRW